VATSKYESLSAKIQVDFPEYDEPPAEPLGLMRRWLADAREHGVREPSALALATADAFGRSSTRVVAISALTDRGVLFTTHSGSRKGRDLAANTWASGVFYWRETSQQLVVAGPALPVGDAEADALWNARPVPLHAMSTVSHQSEPLDDGADLLARARELEGLGPLPRPDRFVGYLLEPVEVEFWCAHPDRLHRRLRYDRDGAAWRVSRLQP